MNRPHFFIRLIIFMILALSFTACHKEPKEKPEEPILVTDIGLNTDKLILAPGDTATIMATVQPEHATNKTVTWESSNPAVATVTNDGLVTAITNGKATITATTQDGGKTVTCNVTVDYRVQWVGNWDFEVIRSWSGGAHIICYDTIYRLGKIKIGETTDQLKMEYGQNFRITAEVDEFGILTNINPNNPSHINKGQFEGNENLKLQTLVWYFEDHSYISSVEIFGTKKKGGNNE